MSFVDAGILTEANVTLNMQFKRAYDREVVLVYKEIATETTSNALITKYPVAGPMTGLREWLGERIYDNFSRYAFSLKNRTFEKSIEIPVNDLEDDQLDGYGMVMDQLAYQAKLWPQRQVITALLAGAATPCFDGQNFFDPSHPVVPGDASQGTFSNLFTTTPLTNANFSAVLSAMQVIPNRDGDPLGFDTGSELVLLVPAGLREIANQIVTAPYLASGATNVNAGLAKVLVIPQLGSGGGANATSWYLMQLGGPIKPLIWQLRKAPQLTSLVNLNDPNVFEQDIFRWGLKARGVAGFTFPWLAAKANA